jgi:hypothetical protein
VVVRVPNSRNRADVDTVNSTKQRTLISRLTKSHFRPYSTIELEGHHLRMDTMSTQTHSLQSNIITCTDPFVDDLDRHGYLFGYPIAHSVSPLFHQTCFDHFGLRWSQQLLPSTDMQQFLRLLRDPRLYGELHHGCFIARESPLTCRQPRLISNNAT